MNQNHRINSNRLTGMNNIKREENNKNPGTFKLAGIFNVNLFDDYDSSQSSSSQSENFNTDSNTNYETSDSNLNVLNLNQTEENCDVKFRDHELMFDQINQNSVSHSYYSNNESIQIKKQNNENVQNKNQELMKIKFPSNNEPMLSNRQESCNLVKSEPYNYESDQTDQCNRISRSNSSLNDDRDSGYTSLSSSSNCRLLVTNLPRNLTAISMRNLFSTCGTVIYYRLRFNAKTGLNNGNGKLVFSKEEEAQAAIDTFNGYKLQNKWIKVTFDTNFQFESGNHSHRSSTMSDRSSILSQCSSFNMDLNENLNKNQTKQSESNNLLDGNELIKIMNLAIKSACSQNTTDLASSTLEKAISAAAVTAAAYTAAAVAAQFSKSEKRNCSSLDINLEDNIFTSNSKRSKSDFYELYVGNIGQADQDDLYGLFLPYGKPFFPVIAKSRGLKRGFGFISFQTLDEAANAIRGLNGFIINNRQSLIVKFKEIP